MSALIWIYIDSREIQTSGEQIRGCKLTTCQVREMALILSASVHIPLGVSFKASFRKTLSFACACAFRSAYSVDCA